MESSGLLTKKRALSIVLLAAALFILLIGLRWAGQIRSNSVKTTQGREKFLLELGWEIDPASEECRDVVIPDELEGLMEEYNRMQRAQGYDLSAYCGKTCRQYSYTVTNYPGYDKPVTATIYVYGSKVIAGDIHTAAVDGFMHSIKRSGE